MDRLSHRLDIVDVPEQFRVALMRGDVVCYRAVACRIFTDAQDTGSAAGVFVALPDFLSELLPCSGVIPLAPRLGFVPIP